MWGDCSAEYEGTGDLFGWEYDHVSVGQSVAVDLRAMSARLRDLISNPALRATMAENSRARALRHFSYSAVAAQYDDLFAETMSIASRISAPDPPPRFDQPDYFKVYRHYPTRVLTSRDRVAVDCSRPDAIVKIARASLAIASGVGGLQVIDYALIDRLLAHLHTGGEAGVEIGELNAFAAAAGYSNAAVLRHCLWLLKYGLLREVRT